MTADPIMHDLPQHSSRHIVGVMDAWVDKENRDNKMELIMLGARSGEIKVKVSGVDQPTPGATSWLDGLVYLDCRDNPVSGSDSGAPCFSKVSETEYKLVYIMSANFGSNYAALAIPASTVERELGITFGSPAPDLVPVPPAPAPTPPTVNRPPIADAGPDRTVDSRELVHLNGTKSADDNEGDVLAYSWRQLPGVGGHTVILGHAATAEPFFLAPVGPAELFFELTVTDRAEATDTDKVKITVNAPPTPPPTPTPTPDTGSGADTDTDGSTDTDTTIEPPVTPWQDTGVVRGSGADREKEQVRYNNITGDFDTRWVADPEVWGEWADNGNTMEDPIAGWLKEQSRTSDKGSTQTQWVPDPAPPAPPPPTPEPPIVWRPWEDTGTTRGCGPSQEKEQRRTSNRGGIQHRWMSDSRPEVWGSWSGTGRTLGSGQTREAQESRTSNCNNTETRWVSDPEPETWGAWTDTGETMTIGAGYWVKEQARTSSYGNRETRWVAG